jgi:HEPN domain-containing protein
MNEEIVKLWLLKADNDFKTGKDELATESPATDTICFHMQQCVEKHLKAFLVSKGVEISKSHNLSLVLQQCADVDPDFEKLKSSGADELTPYAVNARYPDDFYMPSQEETQNAVRMAEKVNTFVLAKIKPST